MSIIRKINKKIIRPQVILPFILFLLLIGGGIFYWLQQSLPPQDEARGYLEGSQLVEVRRRENLYEFWPRTQKNYSEGIIFYPGAQVEAAAYAGMAHKLAEAGYPVFLVKMPFQMSILNWDKAENIIFRERDKIENWTMIGHSLGGAMSARFISRRQPEEVRNLILLAAYPAESDNLSQIKINVLSLYGSRDEIINLPRLRERIELLPEDAEIVELEGANHAGFGFYGEQDGDGEAEISSLTQQQLAVEKILKFIASGSVKNK